jgi:hypothetical protein
MAYVPRIPARVDEQGQLRPADPVAWRSYLARNKGRDVWVTVTRQQVSRSPQANRYYWGVVVEEVASYIGESREETHQLLKAQFLPSRDIELLDGKRLKMPPSTTRLTVEEFAWYVEAVRAWAARFLGLSIPDPGEVEVVL